MLKLVDRYRMNKIELYLEKMQVKSQVNSSLGNYTDLLLGENDNVEELDYGCGHSSTLVALTDGCEVYEDGEDCEDEDCEGEEGDDESDGDGDVQHDANVSFFLTFHQVMENEQGRYILVDMEGCDFSNNPHPEDPIEYAPVQYQLAPSGALCWRLSCLFANYMFSRSRDLADDVNSYMLSNC